MCGCALSVLKARRSCGGILRWRLEALWRQSSSLWHRAVLALRRLGGHNGSQLVSLGAFQPSAESPLACRALVASFVREASAFGEVVASVARSSRAPCRISLARPRLPPPVPLPRRAFGAAASPQPPSVSHQGHLRATRRRRREDMPGNTAGGSGAKRRRPPPSLLSPPPSLLQPPSHPPPPSQSPSPLPPPPPPSLSSGAAPRPPLERVPELCRS